MSKKNGAVSTPQAWHVYVVIATQCAVLAAREGRGKKLTDHARKFLREHRFMSFPEGDADMMMHDLAFLVRHVAIPEKHHGAVRTNLRGSYAKQGLWRNATLYQLEEALVTVGADRATLRRPRSNEETS